MVATTYDSNLLVSGAVQLNKVAIPDFDGICSTDILVFRPPKGLLPRYLLGCLSQSEVVQYATDRSKGNSLPRVSFKDLGELSLSIPPLAEQKRIVTKVEALLEGVNQARERLARVPDILKRFRQSVLAAACSGQLTADWREENPNSTPVEDLICALFRGRNARYLQQCRDAEALGKRQPKKPSNLARQSVDTSELPELPSTWEWVSWNDLADWITYGFTRKMPHVRDGLPIVTAKNVRDGFIDFSNVHYTTEEAFATLSEKDKPRRDEILITKDGAIRGRAAVVETDKPFCISQAVAVVRFGGVTANTQYLLRVIQSRFSQSLIEQESEGTAIPHISITNFGRFPVPLAPLAEQEEIVHRVGAMFALADRIEQRLMAATTRTERITQSVLAKAFSGELVETEADLARREARDYEPASVLLERIAAERAAAENGKPKRTRKPRSKPASKPRKVVR